MYIKSNILESFYHNYNELNFIKMLFVKTIKTKFQKLLGNYINEIFSALGQSKLSFQVNIT